MEVSDMCGETGFGARLAAVVILLCAGRVSFGLVDVVNYDNHPELEKAKTYDLTLENSRFRRADGSFDLELYEAYRDKGNRELAEQHYLAYLQDVTDSFQRAAVYARLGDLFSGITDAHVATTTNTSKARVYYRKALEAEPERIGWATLHARGFFAGDASTNEQRFASYMDYYQWLLSIDEKTLKEKALPTRPARKITPAQQEDEAIKKMRERFKTMTPQEEEAYRKMRERFKARTPTRPKTSGGGFLEDIKGQAEVTAYNLVNEAAGRMAIDPQTHMPSQGLAIQHLMMLIERFPGTSAARRARTELARTTTDLADEVLAALEKDLDANWRMAFIPTASRADANEPYILDLVRCRLLLPPGRLHTEETFAYLTRQQGDHLAWDGAFVVPNGSQLAVAHPPSPLALNVVRDQSSASYELPKGVVLPCHLWLSAKSGQKYLLRVIAVKPEGVSFFYRSATEEELAAGTRAATAPATKGKDGPAESTR
jgi:tetratricopeptide (TPR) repeat protein